MANVAEKKITPNGNQIPVRLLHFNFYRKNFDPNFYRNSEVASAYFHALSIFLTFGEDLVIDTARYHRNFLTDPELKRRVTALIGQEAVHSRLHDEFNDTLVHYRYQLNLFRFFADNVLYYVFKSFPTLLHLTLVACMAH